eukprot:TRINITY_DN2050_c0_g1_i1.p1 TRINITY_DN2050_c0_g1~~TRINITY_DN2050_c0_g1_i1.p1  ORF type:complete len:100 (+),score=13.10 TRINITY_DN2050_c0_g1_i1:241-540(+)
MNGFEKMAEEEKSGGGECVNVLNGGKGGRVMCVYLFLPHLAFFLLLDKCDMNGFEKMAEEEKSGGGECVNVLNGGKKTCKLTCSQCLHFSYIRFYTSYL